MSKRRVFKDWSDKSLARAGWWSVALFPLSLVSFSLIVAFAPWKVSLGLSFTVVPVIVMSLLFLIEAADEFAIREKSQERESEDES